MLRTTNPPTPTTIWESCLRIRATSHYHLASPEIRFELDYDGGGAGKGADVRLKLNGDVVAEGRLEKTIASRFSIDEGADVGLDRGSAVTIQSVGPRRYSAYGGQIDKVTLEIYPKSSDAKI